jgi:hypothetical protein
MTIEVRSGEERRRRILDQCLFVGLRRHPEDDDIRIALTGAGIGGIGARIPEEHEGSAADLIHRVAT